VIASPLVRWHDPAVPFRSMDPILVLPGLAEESGRLFSVSIYVLRTYLGIYGQIEPPRGGPFLHRDGRLASRPHTPRSVALASHCNEAGRARRIIVGHHSHHTLYRVHESESTPSLSF